MVDSKNTELQLYEIILEALYKSLYYSGNRRKAHALAHQELTFIDDSIEWESSFDNRLKMMLKRQELDSTSEPTSDPSSEPTTESSSEPTKSGHLEDEKAKRVGRVARKVKTGNKVPEPTSDLTSETLSTWT